MRYFSAKTIGGRGGVHAQLPHESMETFKEDERIVFLKDIWEVQYREITKEEYDTFCESILGESGKVVDIDRKDDYSNQILENFNGDILEILDKGFSIRGQYDNP